MYYLGARSRDFCWPKFSRQKSWEITTLLVHQENEIPWTLANNLSPDVKLPTKSSRKQERSFACESLVAMGSKQTLVITPLQPSYASHHYLISRYLPPSTDGQSLRNVQYFNSRYPRIEYALPLVWYSPKKCNIPRRNDVPTSPGPIPYRSYLLLFTHKALPLDVCGIAFEFLLPICEKKLGQRRL